MRRPLTRWLQHDEARLTTGQRTTHTYVIGQPGTGKSRAIESWVMQDIWKGQGVGVLDPHGDLFHNLVSRLSAHPELWERVIVIDPTDPDWVVGINPLQAIRGLSSHRLSGFMTDVVVKIWRIDSSVAPRMVWLLTNSLLALTELGLTLLDLPRFLLDTDYRENLLPRLTSEQVLTYFYLEYPKKEGAIHQWATPILNKLGGLLFDPDLRSMLSGTKSLDWRSVIDGRKVVLVNLSKGILGEMTGLLLGAFILAQLQKAALSRADARWRPPFYLYLDEFQHYTTDNIIDILSESRKYALSLTLAHQYLDQLPSTLREAALNTAGTLVSFRVSRHDAMRLAKEIFPSSQRQDEIHLRHRSIGGFPLLNMGRRQGTGGWDRRAGQLVSLPYRHFWSRQRTMPRPVNQRSLEVPDIPFTSDRREAIRLLREASGQRYGQRKEQHRMSHHPFSGNQTVITDEDVPFWEVT